LFTFCSINDAAAGIEKSRRRRRQALDIGLICLVSSLFFDRLVNSFLSEKRLVASDLENPDAAGSLQSPCSQANP
jgi:hypothetical protein